MVPLGASTAYVERTHLTSRHFNSRLVRKLLGYSKTVALHRAMAVWEDVAYNLVRPLKTLRQEVLDDPTRRWRPRTPAIVSGLTDHIEDTKPCLCQHSTGRVPSDTIPT